MPVPLPALPLLLFLQTSVTQETRPVNFIKTDRLVTLWKGRCQGGDCAEYEPFMKQ